MKTKQKKYLYPNPPSVTEMSIPDNPVSFGYKFLWIAIPGEDPNPLIKALDLSNMQPCNWNTGIQKSYENYVFITPPVAGWTMACGLGLPSEIEYAKEILADLSKICGEAQYFCTHRVTEYHCWIRAIDGNIVRSYAYLGETGENLIIEGDPTEFEKDLSLVNTFSEEAKDENYFDRKDITIPDEETVMHIAANWSVDPTTLESRNDIRPGLGLLCEA